MNENRKPRSGGCKVPDEFVRILRDTGTITALFRELTGKIANGKQLNKGRRSQKHLGAAFSCDTDYDTEMTIGPSVAWLSGDEDNVEYGIGITLRHDTGDDEDGEQFTRLTIPQAKELIRRLQILTARMEREASRANK